jgi:hypothetical protein
MSSPEHSLQSGQTGRPRASIVERSSRRSLRVDSLPGVLRVRVPRHSAGVSSAWGTAPLTRKNLGALIRIAAGKSAAATSGKV